MVTSRNAIGGQWFYPFGQRAREGSALLLGFASAVAFTDQNVDLAVYPDELSRSIARSLLDSGNDFRFGLSDLQPIGFGGVEGQGLRKELQDFLVSRDVDTTASRLEAEARAAFGP